MIIKSLKALKRQYRAERAAAKKVELEISSEPPTYTIERAVSPEEGRRLIAQAIDNFIRAAEQWHADCAAATEQPPPPPVHAIRVTTAGGKTDGFEDRFGADRARRRLAGETGPMATRPVFYVTPLHKLNEEIEKGFRRQGLDARIYRGREQDDPADKDHPDDRPQRLMCWQPHKLKEAKALGASIAESCCWSRTRELVADEWKWVDHECVDYPGCSYYRQTANANTKPPDCWLAANNMLFHPQAALGEVCAVVIDESFVMQGITGGDGYRLDDLAVDDVEHFGCSIPQPSRRPLLEALAAQESDGGLLLASLPKKIGEAHCTQLHKAEWRFINENASELRPDMSAKELKSLERKGPELRRAKFMAGIYNAVREMIRKEITASGHVVLDTDADGHRVVRLRGVHDVVKKWQRPTLIMDATLPTKEVLQIWFPQVEITAEIDIAAAHQHVRQVIRTPTAISKLFEQKKPGGEQRKPKSGEHNLHLVHRKIVELWFGSGKASTLVICQKDTERWLREQGLPEGIALVHFNDFTGLDAFKNVDHIIVVGRTAVGPRVVEADAGAMTGVEPVKVPEGETWYPQEDRFIALAGGGTVRVKGDRHPDRMAEAMRWQVTEAGVIQGIGRGRGIHRTAENPLYVTVLSNLCLPIVVDEVVAWKAANKVVEMLKAGLVVLGSATDAAKLQPKVWANWKAAQRSIRAFMGRRGEVNGQTPKEKSLSLGKCPLTAEGELAAPGAAGGADGQTPKEKTLSLGKCPSALLETAPGDWLPITYQHRATGAKHIPAMFDPAIVPFPREPLVRGLGDLGSLCHIVKQPKIGDFGGKGGLRVDMALIKATTIYETMPIELRFQALGLPLPSKAA